MVAAKEGPDADFVKALLKRGPVDKRRHGHLFEAALRIAIKFGNLKIAKILTGSPEFCVDYCSDGETFLHSAIDGLINKRKNAFQLMRWILKYDPDMNVTNMFSQTVENIIAMGNNKWIKDRIKEAHFYNMIDEDFKHPELGNYAG